MGACHIPGQLNISRLGLSKSVEIVHERTLEKELVVSYSNLREGE